MPSHFSQHENKPIAVARFHGFSSFADFKTTFYQINHMLAERDDPKIFLLIDMCDMDLSYSDMILAFEAAQQRGYLAHSSSRLIPIVVGSYDLIQVFKDIALNRCPRLQIPYFHSLDAAYSFLHHLLN